MKQNSRFMMALRSGLAALTLMLLAVPAFAQKVEVKGTVADAESGQPLIGVTIISDSGSGTTTDGNGHYSLLVGSNDNITFDYLGYNPVKEKVGGRTTINVGMTVDAKSIEEVVVLGYTTQKKAEISSSIVSLDSEALNDLTTSDVGSMLQGKAAGVLVMSASGQPGEAADIRIRGTGSITAGAGPLYVVDGVAGGSFNPNDVETITILKDAAATALYGASASGGVIVVTTKSAQSDKPIVNFKA
ncbi:MAG: TonB-dependent receptor plug domain-containing protein, partial [Tidjanibacter sp.]|nr:TonB-dependent receptor plug domain-containing protein [Tidjanibacter sp.]